MNIDIHLMNYPQFQFRDKLTSETERRGFLISAVSRQTISRLPVYLGYLRSLEGSMLTISATAMAEALSLNDVQVREGFSRRQLFRQA